MSRYKATISVVGTFDIYVDTYDGDEFGAEEMALDQAKKLYSELGIVDPEFSCDVLEEIIEEDISFNRVTELLTAA